MAQASEYLPAEALGKAPWPGMTAWDVAWCRELVFRAVFVEIRVEGLAPKIVRVKDARGWLKPNGFYGLRINGQPVDEKTVWVMYAGQMIQVRTLFTYGSAPAHEASPFRD